MDWAHGSHDRERLAFGLSLGVHAGALLALAALLAGPLISDTGPIEKDVDLHVTTIVHRDPAPAKVATAKPRHDTAAGTQTKVEIRPYVRISTVAQEQPTLVTRTAAIFVRAQARHAPPQVPANAAPEPVPNVAAVRQVAVAAVATPVATTASEPAPDSATPLPAVGADYSGLFSQNYPPEVATPDELASIRAEVTDHVRIRVDVDDAGHATDVEFLTTLADQSLAARIRSELMDLRYVPADCNGLHCEGSLVVML